MTCHATCKSISITEITSPNGYGAVDFEAALCQFIVQFQNPKLTCIQIEEASYDVHLPLYSLPVFHKIKFWNEEDHENVTLNSIHAYSARHKDGSITRAAHFDTALVFLQKPGVNGVVVRNWDLEQPAVSGVLEILLWLFQ